jgi:two-component system response regulator HydG
MNLQNIFRVLIVRPWIISTISLLLIGIILALASLSFQATKNAAFHEFNQKQLVKVNEAVFKIESYFESISWALRSLGNLSGVHNFDERSTRQVLALEIQELKPLGINEIGVLDSNGVLRYNAVVHQKEGADYSEMKYFRQTKEMATADTYTIALVDPIGIETDKKEILIAVPMFAYPPEIKDISFSGAFSGIVFCTLGLDHFIQTIIAPLKFSKRGHAFLIDNQYEVLWMPDKSFVGKSLYEEAFEFPAFQNILEKMVSGESGTGEFSFYSFDNAVNQVTKDIEERLIAYEFISLGHQLWALGLCAPKKDAEKRIHSPYVNHLILLICIIVTTVLGLSYTITMAFRYNKNLKTEVEAQTNEFKTSHLRLLTVLDSLDAAIFVADIETCEILFVNQYLCNFYSDVVGKPCWQLLNAGQKGPCDFCVNDKPPESDYDKNGVHVREYQDSKTGKWFQIRNRAIRWVDGRSVSLEIAEDITDQKRSEIELKRAHQELGTFCGIIKEMGVQTTLDDIGSFLMMELNKILSNPNMRLLIFNRNHDLLFALSDRKTEVFSEPELIQNASTILSDLSDITISSKRIFTPPLIPADFPAKGSQTIVPLQFMSPADGALIIACGPKCRCEEKELNLVSLILAQSAGTIQRAIIHEEEIHNLQRRIEQTSEYFGIVGKNAKMQVVYKLIDDIAPSDASVLIQGESGTGKELVANAIHRKSLRKNKPFVVINCAAYPATLFESEIFGHEKGAFTGAIRQKIGRFEQADGGTIFLDEIGEIQPSAQIKLLRVLQSQKFERIGGTQTISIDVRILAATNKNLLEEVKNDRFREDLFYRLNVIPIKLPPLRLRRNDIPLLASYFQKRFTAEMGKDAQDFSSEVMRRFLDYDWPGNVRELENSIEHAVVLSKGSRIELTHLPSSLGHSRQELNSALSSRSLIEHEKKHLLEVMEECAWNKSQAARRLGISRSTLYDKLKKYQVSRPSATIH